MICDRCTERGYRFDPKKHTRNTINETQIRCARCGNFIKRIDDEYIKKNIKFLYS